jgi:hypothetical protein
MRTRTIVLLLASVAVVFFVYTQLTIFLIQPIGAIPEGRTLIIWRTGKLHFLDSADAVCIRETGGLNLLCRMAVLGAIAKADTIIVRLPFSETLYLITTDGRRFDR